MEVLGHYFSNSSVATFLLIHLAISFILMLIASYYVSKRYVSDGDEVLADDYKRLERVKDKGFFFKALFNVSLHKNNPISSKFFFFVFNVSIPIIGYIETIWIAYILRNTVYEEETVDTNILDLEEFEISFLEVERVFGEGSMLGVLLSPFVPLAKKIRALSALASHKSPATLQIIRQALSSKNDEVRLFAYATINNLEKKLSTDISTALNTYKEYKEKENNLTKQEERIMYNAARELAFYYWEMVYTEISHDALKNNFLKEVIKYAAEATKYYQSEVNRKSQKILHLQEEIQKLGDVSKDKDKKLQNDRLIKELDIVKSTTKNDANNLAKLYVLQGRVYMTKKEYEKAREYFVLAQEIKESDSDFVIPYLAEIFFIQGNYQVVKNIIKNKAETLSLNPKLYPIIQQWSAVNE